MSYILVKSCPTRGDLLFGANEALEEKGYSQTCNYQQAKDYETYRAALYDNEHVHYGLMTIVRPEAVFQGLSFHRSEAQRSCKKLFQ